MNLHNVNIPAGATKFCGPSALSALTGHDTGTIEWWLRAKYPRDYPGPVRITYLHHLRDYLLAHRYSACRYPVGPPWSCVTEDDIRRYGVGIVPDLSLLVSSPRESLQHWLRRTAKRRGDGVWLLRVTGHFVVARGIYIVDSAHKTPTLISGVWCRRKMVTDALLVEASPA